MQCLHRFFLPFSFLSHPYSLFPPPFTLSLSFFLHFLSYRIYSVLNSLGLYNKNAKILFLVREKKKKGKNNLFFSSAAIDRRRGNEETAVPLPLSRALSLSLCYLPLPGPSLCDARGGCALEARKWMEALKRIG